MESILQLRGRGSGWPSGIDCTSPPRHGRRSGERHVVLGGERELRANKPFPSCFLFFLSISFLPVCMHLYVIRIVSRSSFWCFCFICVIGASVSTDCHGYCSLVYVFAIYMLFAEPFLVFECFFISRCGRPYVLRRRRGGASVAVMFQPCWLFALSCRLVLSFLCSGYDLFVDSWIFVRFVRYPSRDCFHDVHASTCFRLP